MKSVVIVALIVANLTQSEEQQSGTANFTEENLRESIVRYSQVVRDNDQTVSEVEDVFESVATISKKPGDFRAIDRLEELFSNLPKEYKKYSVVNRQLAKLYTHRAVHKGRPPTNSSDRDSQLVDLQRAFLLDPRNDITKQWLTILGFGDDEIAKKAMAVYDPTKDSNPAWFVLAELSHHANQMGDFEKSVKYLQRARKKVPRHAQLLNNLAFAKLNLKNPEAEEALLLVDQAIVILHKDKPSKLVREALVASFMDTRGDALMSLSRYEEAAKSFEVVAKIRKNETEILKKMIECYTKFDKQKAAEIRDSLR